MKRVFAPEYCGCRIHCLHPLAEYCGCSCTHCTHGSYAYVMSIALLWNRQGIAGIVPLVNNSSFGTRTQSEKQFLSANRKKWLNGVKRGLGKCVWHLALPFHEYFRQFWYPHLQRFQYSSDNCGKIHVRIILGHPIGAMHSNGTCQCPRCHPHGRIGFVCA